MSWEEANPNAKPGNATVSVGICKGGNDSRHNYISFTIGYEVAEQLGWSTNTRVKLLYGKDDDAGKARIVPTADKSAGWKLSGRKDSPRASLRFNTSAVPHGCRDSEMPSVRAKYELVPHKNTTAIEVTLPSRLYQANLGPALVYEDDERAKQPDRRRMPNRVNGSAGSSAALAMEQGE